MKQHPIIVTNDLKRLYQSGDGQITALDSVCLQVNQGEFVSIQGASGSGKSTLLSVLGLLESPDDGQYILANAEVSKLGFNQRAQVRNQYIGFIFQAFNLIGSMNLLENVGMPLKYRNGVSKKERESTALALLERVGLVDRARDYPTQLSGGQQQRVAIARALVTSPALLLADEPTGNLDSRHAEEIMRLLTELHQEGATLVMVTHDNDLATMAERQFYMRDGVLTEDTFDVEYKIQN